MIIRRVGLDVLMRNQAIAESYGVVKIEPQSVVLSFIFEGKLLKPDFSISLFFSTQGAQEKKALGCKNQRPRSGKHCFPHWKSRSVSNIGIDALKFPHRKI
jgi:hypothetical protein